MTSKRQREQLSAARAASVEFFKKRRQEASSIYNLLQQPSVHNDKPNTIDISPADTSDEEVYHCELNHIEHIWCVAQKYLLFTLTLYLLSCFITKVISGLVSYEKYINFSTSLWCVRRLVLL